MDKIKQNKGFTTVDIVIAVIIVMLFVSLIAALFYNSYIVSVSNKRNSEANAYITQIFEKIDLIDYDALEEKIIENVNAIDAKKLSAKIVYVDGTSNPENLTTPYKAEIKIQKYNETEGNEEKEDLIKIVNVVIKYNINKKEESIESKRIKTIEVANKDNNEITPNILNGMKPIKYLSVNGEQYWQITKQKDTTWFSYSNNKPANSVLSDVTYNEEDGKVINLGSMFVYIPRFSYIINNDNTVDIKFLNQDNTCKDGSDTVSYDEAEGKDNTKNYVIPKVFNYNENKLTGVWIGKYLCRRNADGLNISVNSEDLIWNDLTQTEQQQKCENMVATDNNYGLSEDTKVLVVNDDVNNAINYIKASQYSEITNEILDNSNDYPGAFRIYMF